MVFVGTAAGRVGVAACGKPHARVTMVRTKRNKKFFFMEASPIYQEPFLRFVFSTRYNGVRRFIILSYPGEKKNSPASGGV
jgi:hypothetical protein